METVSSPNFGNLLRHLRISADMTQEELAAAARLSTRAISDLERGIRRSPRRDTVELLAGALKLTPAQRAELEMVSQRRGMAPARSNLLARTRHDDTPVPLVGRTRETGLMQRHLAEEGPPMLLLAGEPGIGKTSLLRYAADAARSMGWTVLEGGCDRRSGQEPYAPVLQAIEHHLTALSLAQRRAALLGCAWLVRLLPELAETNVVPVPAWTLPPEQERRLMFGAADRLLMNVAGPAGTLLVLDDLQWAGPDALDLLATLVGNDADVRVRVLAAYRDTEAQQNDTLATLLADLATAKRAYQITVGPLEPHDAAALARALLHETETASPEAEAHLIARAGGVPFYLVSCAQAMRSASPESDDPPAVPWDVAQGVQQRLIELPRTAQHMLNLAAIVGRSAPRALLVSIAASVGLEESAALDALDAACRTRLLVEVSEDSYTFAHDLIREAIVARLSAARRAALHRQVAEALERESGAPRVELLAHHFGQAGDHDRAFYYLEQVGDRARGMCAYSEAESAYTMLAAQLDQHHDEMRAADIRLKLGTMLMGLARYDEALAALERARQVYTQAEALEALGHTVAQIGWVYALAGRPEEGLARLRPLPGPLSTSLLSPRARAKLHLALAKLCTVSARYDEQLLAAERAATLAREVDDGRLLAQAEMRRGDALQALGRTEEAAGVLAAAIPLAEAAGEQFSLCFALNDLAVAYRARGDFERDRLHTEQALEIAERLAEPTMIVFVRHRRGINAWCRGDWQSARADLNRALELSEQIGPSWAAGYASLGLGMFLLSAGEETEAKRRLSAAQMLGERSGDIQILRWVAVSLAENELLLDQPESALRRLSPLLDRAGQREALVTVLLPFVAWAYLDLGDGETARELVEQAQQRAADHGILPALVDALRVRALVAARAGRYDEARDALAEALAQAGTMTFPLCEARTLYVAGLCHTLCGDAQPARASFEAALTIFHRLGERPYADRAEAALAAPSALATRRLR